MDHPSHLNDSTETQPALQLGKQQLKSANDAHLSEDDVLRVQAALRTIHAKISLSEEEIEETLRRATIKTVPSAGVIMREGELSQFIIWILRGEVAVHRHDRGLLCTIASGFVGHHSYIYDKPRSATVMASGGAVSYVQLTVPRHGVISEDHHELEREELQAMNLASSALAASLSQEAADVAQHVHAHTSDVAQHVHAHTSEHADETLHLSALERHRVLSYVQASAQHQRDLQAQLRVYEANVKHAEHLRRQCDAVQSSIAELQQRKAALLAAFADVASSSSSDSESRVQHLQTLARDTANCDSMCGVAIETQQNYASKLLLAAIQDMRDSVSSFQPAISAVP